MKSIIEMARQAGFEQNSLGMTYTSGSLSALIERFAAIVRAQTLEEAANVTGEFAQKWWSMHCASNKHMETTRKAHDDFCALQVAIRALKGQP